MILKITWAFRYSFLLLLVFSVEQHLDITQLSISWAELSAPSPFVFHSSFVFSVHVKLTDVIFQGIWRGATSGDPLDVREWHHWRLCYVGSKATWCFSGVCVLYRDHCATTRKCLMHERYTHPVHEPVCRWSRSHLWVKLSALDRVKSVSIFLRGERVKGEMLLIHSPLRRLPLACKIVYH